MAKLSKAAVKKILRDAYEEGVDTGRSAAGWYIQDTLGGRASGDTKETARMLRKQMDDGDPALYDSVQLPDLSGEYADGPTPRSLAEEYGIGEDNDPDNIILDDICSEWEEGVNTGFWAEVDEAVNMELS